MRVLSSLIADLRESLVSLTEDRNDEIPVKISEEEAYLQVSAAFYGSTGGNCSPVAFGGNRPSSKTALAYLAGLQKGDAPKPAVAALKTYFEACLNQEELRAAAQKALGELENHMYDLPGMVPARY